MRALVVVVLAAAGAAAAQAQDHGACPMMAKAGHQAQVDGRHEHHTGIPTEGTQHHFLITDDGGSIRLGVTDSTATQAREQVRTHLQAITRAFAAGDFSLPMRIHDQVPPGVKVMKARRDRIRYAYADSPEGGVVTLSTRDPESLAAIHAFLRFQIEDHATGDPTE